MFNKTIASIFMVLSSLAYIFPAQAATAAKNLEQSCKADIQKYCSDVTRGDGRIAACLKAHDDKLSDSCSKQWSQAKNEWKKTLKAQHAACGSDVQKFCSNAMGPKDISSCLDSHKNELSAACQAFQSQYETTG